MRLNYGIFIVPKLQCVNAVSDAAASRNAGALPDEFPRRSVGTIKCLSNQKTIKFLNNK